MKTTLILLAALGGLAGCSTTTRAVTHINWYNDPQSEKAYIAYWEGNCGSTGCGAGDSFLQLCTVQKDNSVKCERQTAAEKLLNTHR
jgi:hypothetical protein